MSEQVKQEGDFKMKSKPKMKKLVNTPEVAKVDLAAIAKEQEPTKVVIPTETKESDAIQEQSAESSVLRTEEPKVELQEVGQGNEEPIENVRAEEPQVIQEITEEEIAEEAANVKEDIKEAVQEQALTGKPLPENIEKLVSFMEETGGTVEDYVRLNADYSTVDNKTLLREYYKQTRPHLDADEVAFLMEDNFEYDEELDEERDIKKKKLAFKEEVAKAKNFLEQTKSKYYDEIKLRPGVTQEQQKAMDFFNRYTEQQTYAEKQQEVFKKRTKELFTNDFKGFDFNLGEKKFRYGIQNADQVAEAQSDINNFVKKFLDKDGNLADQAGYHKALYAAMNADRMANHFYEQGKADAVKEVVNKSKNVSNAAPRQVAGDNVFINGLKVKAISGLDTSKLKIQTKKFNN